MIETHKQFKKGDVLKCRYRHHTSGMYFYGEYYRGIVIIVRTYTYYCVVKIGDRDYSQNIVIQDVISDKEWENHELKGELKELCRSGGVTGDHAEEIRKSIIDKRAASEKAFAEIEVLLKKLEESTTRLDR